jgi:hypothetical protein
MPRPRKSARLWLRPARRDRAEIYVILDGGTETSTGCGKGDLAGAERCFEVYLKTKHNPRAGRGGDPNAVKVADAISVYWTEHAQKLARPDAIRRRLDNLLEFFGLNIVADLNGTLQRQYVEQRGSQSAARRDLEDLAAAINWHLRDKVGGAIQQFRPVLPDAAEARDRWLTRSEAARLIWTAWRARQRHRGGGLGPHTGKHVARFILIGLYSGSRSGAICGAALMPTIGRGFVDLDRGIFVRKGLGVRETNKRQPTVDINPRLLAHMRRWQRLGISNHSVIEWQGKPVLRISKAFESILPPPNCRMSARTRCGIRRSLGCSALASPPAT